MMKKYIAMIIAVHILSVQGMAQTFPLDSCKRYALENNKRITEARMHLEASHEVKKNAFTHFFPKVDAGGLAFKANKGLLHGDIPEMNLPVYDGNPANLPTATQFAYFPGLNINMLDYTNAGFVTAIQPVYMGGKIRNGNKLATIGEEVSEYQLHLSTDEVLVKTEDYYWTIVALEEKKKTLLRYEELVNNLKKDVNVAYQAGLIPKSDLLKIEIELNQIRAHKMKLENGLTLLKMALAQHIGIEYSEDFKVEMNSLDENPPEVLYADPQNALVNRAEFKMLNKAVDAEVLHKNISRSEHLPTVAVGIQGLYLDVLEQQNTLGLAFATVSIPISEWWGGTHKMNEHKLKIEMAQNNLDEKSELLILQINKTYNNLQESYSQIAVAEATLAQSEVHLKEITDNYDAGIVKTSDLLEAQAMLQKSSDAVVDTKTIYKIKQAYYLQAIAKIN